MTIPRHSQEPLSADEKLIEAFCTWQYETGARRRPQMRAGGDLPDLPVASDPVIHHPRKADTPQDDTPLPSMTGARLLKSWRIREKMFGAELQFELFAPLGRTWLIDDKPHVSLALNLLADRLSWRDDITLFLTQAMDGLYTPYAGAIADELLMRPVSWCSDSRGEPIPTDDDEQPDRSIFAEPWMRNANYKGVIEGLPATELSVKQRDTEWHGGAPSHGQFRTVLGTEMRYWRDHDGGWAPSWVLPSEWNRRAGLPVLPGPMLAGPTEIDVRRWIGDELRPLRDDLDRLRGYHNALVKLLLGEEIWQPGDKIKGLLGELFATKSHPGFEKALASLQDRLSATDDARYRAEVSLDAERALSASRAAWVDAWRGIAANCSTALEFLRGEYGRDENALIFASFSVKSLRNRYFDLLTAANSGAEFPPDPVDNAQDDPSHEAESGRPEDHPNGT